MGKTDRQDAPSDLDPQRRRAAVRLRRRHRILQATAVLPSLATICNGLSGFAAIHFATRNGMSNASPNLLILASSFVFVAMVFDMLDGRLARMTRRTSDFGAQLDSMCDVISFGVAPAILMLQAVMAVLHDKDIEGVFQSDTVERVVWGLAAIYVSCAALRLARFNVENIPDESAHMNFRGLPSPGAAAAVSSLVLLLGYVEHKGPMGLYFHAAAAIAICFVTLTTALLMVSRLRYPHIVNQYIRVKRSFAHLVQIIILLAAALWQPLWALAAVTVIYAYSGPVGALVRHWRPAKPPFKPMDAAPPLSDS